MREGKMWGDGFADDSWRALFSVRDWEHVASDEFARLFPALIPEDGIVPERIMAIVLARASEIDARRKVCGSSHECYDTTSPRLGGVSDAGFLRDAVNHQAGAPVECFREQDMARFAYLTGVHPAYVWPAAASLASWGTAAAWLGALARHGSALMPEEVADYFADVLAPTSHGRATVKDIAMAEFVYRVVDPGTLMRAARKRLRGSSVAVHRRAVGFEESGWFGLMSRSFGRLWLALRPATAVRAQAP